MQHESVHIKIPVAKSWKSRLLPSHQERHGSTMGAYQNRTASHRLHLRPERSDLNLEFRGSCHPIKTSWVTVAMAYTKNQTASHRHHLFLFFVLFFEPLHAHMYRLSVLSNMQS